MHANTPFPCAVTCHYTLLLHELLKLLLGQFHQTVHFLLGALEVLDTEGIHRHLLHTQVEAPVQCLNRQDRQTDRQTDS